MPVSEDLKQRILFAIWDTVPGTGGAIKRVDIAHHTKLSGGSYETLDRALRELANADLIIYYGRRDPKTNKIRKRWGWDLTPVGRSELMRLTQ